MKILVINLIINIFLITDTIFFLNLNYIFINLSRLMDDKINNIHIIYKTKSPHDICAQFAKDNFIDCISTYPWDIYKREIYINKCRINYRNDLRKCIKYSKDIDSQL